MPLGGASLLAFILCSQALATEVYANVQPISLNSRTVPRGQASALRKRGLKPLKVPLDDFFIQTDLQWFGNITVGTPPQTLPVVFDTGSFTFEIISTECGAPCANQLAFDPSKSSTYIHGDDVSEFPFDTGVGVDPVIGNDYVLTVRTGSDNVGIGPYTVANMSLFTVINQTAPFQIDPFSGILGMSADSRFFLGGLLDQGLPPLFGMYLTPYAIGHAELSLGAIDESKVRGPFKYSALFGGAGGQWAINSPAIYANGKTTLTLAVERDGIIFDSGTSNAYFDKDTAEAIYSLISPNIKPFAAEPGAYGIPCSEIHKLPAKIDIAFNGTDGLPFNLTIPSSELNVGPFKSNSSMCQTFINVSDEFEGFGLVGGSILKHYYSVWDIGNQQMGFARNDISENVE